MRNQTEDAKEVGGKAWAAVEKLGGVEAVLKRLDTLELNGQHGEQ